MAAYQPLIRDYATEERFLTGEFLLQQKFSIIYNIQNILLKYPSLSPKTKLTSFGPIPSMCGSVDIATDQIHTLHYLYKTRLTVSPLIGSHTLRLPALDYFHFVLDVDLKKPPHTRKLSTAEYRQFLVEEDQEEEEVNHFVYRIIHFLTHKLGLHEDPIFILGKGGTLSRGFHVEIPSLVLPYYDYALIINTCREELKFIDPTPCYSIFGSQKYPTTDIEEGQYREYDGSYLPYALFYRGCFDSFIFESLGDAFDTFNICKKVEESKIRKLNTFIYDDTHAISRLKNLLSGTEEEEEEELEKVDESQNIKVGILRKEEEVVIVYKSLNLTNKPEKCIFLENIQQKPSWSLWINPLRDLVKISEAEEEADVVGSIYLSLAQLQRKFTYPPLPDGCVRGRINMTQFSLSQSPFLMRIFPFTIHHIKEVILKSNSHRNTVYYLLAQIYLLSDPKNNNLEEYARLFLPLYDRTLTRIIKLLRKEDNNTKSIHRTWYIECLMNLLITEDVVGFVEAYQLLIQASVPPALQEYLELLEFNTNLVIASPERGEGPRIPRILIVAYSFSSPVAIPLFAAYRPIFCDSSSTIKAWENSRRRWRIHNATSHLAVVFPDLDFLAQHIHRNMTDLRKEEEEGGEVKKKKINPLPPKRELLSEIVIGIKKYWSASTVCVAPQNLPGYIFSVKDERYVLMGGCNEDTGEVFDLLPLFVFKSSTTAEDEYDWSEVKKLLCHISECGFFKTFTHHLKHGITIEKKILSDEYLRQEAIDQNVKLAIEERQEEEEEEEETHLTTVRFEMITGGKENTFSVPLDTAKKFEERYRLSTMSRDQYHIDLGDRLWNRDGGSSTLARYVKHFVLSQLGKEEEGQVPECNCELTQILLILIQIFSYDICSLRYFIQLVIRACKLRSDKYIHVFLGNTNSGKTFLMSLLINALGSNVASLLSSVTAHKGVQDRTHDLNKGGTRTRLWYMDETSGCKKLNATFLKQITGRSRLWIRGNYQDGSMQQLEPTLFIWGNSIPKFDQNCPALMKRLCFLTFRSEFNSEKKLSFRQCVFPQFSSLMTEAERRRPLVAGLVTLFLHAASHLGSLFQEEDFFMPIAVREATIINSPEIPLVNKIFDRLSIVPCKYGYITVKRLNDLLQPDIILRGLDTSPHDAILFIGHQYPSSRVATSRLDVPLTHINMNEKETWIIHGIRESDKDGNDKKRGQLYNFFPPPLNSY